MGKNAPLPAGYTVYPSLPNADRVETAKHYLKMMIFDVESRPKGFDYGGVTAMVGNYLMFIKKFRGHGEVGTLAILWKRGPSIIAPVPHGRKRSQQVVFLIRALMSVMEPGYPPKVIYDAHKELQDQLSQFVADFRQKMKEMDHPDLAKFERELDRVQNFHRVSPW
jgi:hypothetical protein